MSVDFLYDDEDEEKKDAKEIEKEKKKKLKKKNQSKLDSLRAQIISDPVFFDSAEHELDSDELPSTDFDDIEPPIDWIGVKKELRNIAEEEIISIIEMYIDNPKLLESARLKSKMNNYIRKYTKLLYILEMYDNNLVTIQESIDTGDRSKDQFELVNKTGAEISKRLAEIDKMMQECEEFFENYSERYGIESQEEKIVAENVTVNDEDATTVLKMADIADAVNEQIRLMQGDEDEDEDD